MPLEQFMQTHFNITPDQQQPPPSAPSGDPDGAAFNEDNFQAWYRHWSDKTGIAPDPDDPLHKYDYRAAYMADETPSVADDGNYHWPSRFKADDHPNRFVPTDEGTLDSKTDTLLDSFIADNFKGEQSTMKTTSPTDEPVQSPGIGETLDTAGAAVRESWADIPLAIAEKVAESFDYAGSAADHAQEYPAPLGGLKDVKQEGFDSGYRPGHDLVELPSGRVRAVKRGLQEATEEAAGDSPQLQNVAQTSGMAAALADPTMIAAGAAAPKVLGGLRKVGQSIDEMGGVAAGAERKAGEMAVNPQRGNLGGFEQWQKKRQNRAVREADLQPIDKDAPIDIRREQRGLRAEQKAGAISAEELAMQPARSLYNKYKDHVDLFPTGDANSPLRSNMDYGQSVDLDTNCPRNSNCDTLVSRVSGKMKEVLTSDEVFAANQFLHEKGVKAGCIHCYVNTPRRAWLDGKIRLSEEQGINPRIWTDTEFMDKAIKADPLLPAKMAQISKDSRPMMASTPKDYSEYTGQILNMSPEKVAKYNHRAGLRGQSSTDFKPWQAMDWAQMIVDANSKDLMMHLYTKEDDLIELLGDTGVKINMSLAAKGNTPGDISMDLNNGMDWEAAKKYQEQYPDAGIVMNVANQAQMEWAMQQDWIPFVLPYHASGQKASQYASFGAEDFTKIQNPSYRDGRTKLDKKTGKQVPDTPKVDAKGTYENDPAVMKAYNDKYGIDPVFAPYQDDPNHMKLVVDYARWDSPQTVPDPTKFNWEKADQLMSDYVKLGGVNEEVNKELINEFTKRVKKGRKEAGGKP